MKFALYQEPGSRCHFWLKDTGAVRSRRPQRQAEGRSWGRRPSRLQRNDRLPGQNGTEWRSFLVFCCDGPSSRWVLQSELNFCLWMSRGKERVRAFAASACPRGPVRYSSPPGGVLIWVGNEQQFWDLRPGAKAHEESLLTDGPSSSPRAGAVILKVPPPDLLPCSAVAGSGLCPNWNPAWVPRPWCRKPDRWRAALTQTTARGSAIDRHWSLLNGCICNLSRRPTGRGRPFRAFPLAWFSGAGSPLRFLLAPIFLALTPDSRAEWVLRFQPGLWKSAAIWRVQPLRHDALQTEAASVFENSRAILVNMLVVGNGATIAEHFGKTLLARQ